MRRIDWLLTQYAKSHQDPVNKLIHWFCITLIFFSVIGLAWTIQFPCADNPFLNWGTVAMIPIAAYYLFLSRTLAVGMILLMCAFCICAHLLNTYVSTPLWLISTVIFIVSWVFQFIGHMVEGQKPSFLTDVRYLLVGPAWLMHSFYRRVGLPY
ncbi:MAG: Mpo1-like protein [Planctomycetota bacterium]